MRIKITKNTIYFGSYGISRRELNRDGLDDWLMHLGEKPWFDFHCREEFIAWAETP